MEALLALIGKADNIAVLTLLGVSAGLGYLHVVWRREEREDRKQLYAAVEAQTRAVEALRHAISISLGKLV